MVGNFNPLPPYGGRHQHMGYKGLHWYFNPLPPYGGRQLFASSDAAKRAFQSTPSVWRETGEKVSGNEAFQISIHSLRMEGDFLFVRIQRYLIISIHSLRMEGD